MVYGRTSGAVGNDGDVENGDAVWILRDTTDVDDVVRLVDGFLFPLQRLPRLFWRLLSFALRQSFATGWLPMLPPLMIIQLLVVDVAETTAMLHYSKNPSRKQHSQHMRMQPNEMLRSTYGNPSV